MWTPEYFVHELPFPENVDGAVTPNDDGSFSIYVNTRLTPEEREKWLRHELRHISENHFYREEPIATLEREADGEEPQPEPEPKTAEIPLFDTPQEAAEWILGLQL